MILSICIQPCDHITVSAGGNIKIVAEVTCTLPPLIFKWKKRRDEVVTDVEIYDSKYKGSTCNPASPDLIINDVDDSDEGFYYIEVTDAIETATSSELAVNVLDDNSMSKYHVNYFRYHTLCSRATKAVRMLFDSYVPQFQLLSHLSKHKNDLQHHRQWKCTAEQLTILFPGPGKDVTSKDFDFTLLYKLLRNTIKTIQSPSKGWGYPPDVNDRSQTDQIERIRDHRNKLSHEYYTNQQIPDTEFERLWFDLSTAIDILSNSHLRNEIFKLKTTRLEGKAINRRRDPSCMRRFRGPEGSQRRAPSGTDATVIHTHVKRDSIQEMQIQEWKRDDNFFCNETRSFDNFKELMDEKNIVTIIGGPGCGKTSTARHFALSLEKQGYKIIPVKTIDEILSYRCEDVNHVFIYNDPIGIFGLDITDFHQIEKYEQEILTLFKKGNSKLIFTCRKLVYNEAKGYDCYITKNVVDLEDEKTQLNTKEKMNILKKYTGIRKLEESVCIKISKEATYQMFPLNCYRFATKADKDENDVNIFFKPYKFSLSQFDQLKQRNKFFYACLVVCMLKNNELSENDLSDEEVLKDVYDRCGIEKSTKNAISRETLSRLVGTYITKTESMFTFIHDSIFEAMAYHFGKCFPELIIKYLSSRFIANKIRIGEYPSESSDQHLCIILTSAHFGVLAERLLSDIKELELNEVFSNICWSNPGFTETFILKLKGMSYKDMKKYMISEREITQKPSMKNKELKILHVERHSLVLHKQSLLFDDKNKYEHKFGSSLSKRKLSECVRTLNWIVSHGTLRLLKYLIEEVSCHRENTNIIFGANSNERTKTLLLAVHSMNTDMVNLVLNNIEKKCINNCCNLRHTPLTLAVSTGSLEIVQILLKNNADPNNCDEKGKFPLYYASARERIDIIMELCLHGADVNKGQSPLNIACKLGYTDVAKYILGKDCDTNKCDENGKSALHYVSERGDLDILEDLIKRKCDIDRVDNSCKTALHLATEKGHLGVVKYLIKNGCDLNISDNTGKMPLHFVAACGYPDLIEEFAENKFHLNKKDKCGKVALHYAAGNGHLEVVKKLIACGCVLDACDKSGKTSLHVASENGYSEIVKMLVKSQSIVNNGDATGKTPLHYASKCGYDGIVIHLLQNGSDYTKTDNDGKTPYDKAKENGHSDIAKLISCFKRKAIYKHE